MFPSAMEYCPAGSHRQFAEELKLKVAARA
jgi:hypothetical protein